MLSPFGGLKKLFNPKNALKPFKAVHKAVGKVGRATGLPAPPGFGKKKSATPGGSISGGFAKKKSTEPSSSSPVNDFMARAKARKKPSTPAPPSTGGRFRMANKSKSQESY